MKARDNYRFFYLCASAIFLALVFAAFAHQFYLSALFDSAPLPVLLEIHGAVMTGWVLLLVMQSALIVSRRVRWHRSLGVVGAVWAVLVVVSGVVTTLRASVREVRLHSAVAPIQLTVTGFELVEMLLLSFLVVFAFHFRHRRDVHGRLMLLTIFCMLPSVISRAPVDIFPSNLSILLGVYGCWGICVTVDTVRQRRVHPAFAIGGAIIVLSLLAAFFGAYTEGWRNFLAQRLVSAAQQGAPADIFASASLQQIRG